MKKFNLTRFYRNTCALLIMGMLIGGPVSPAFAEEAMSADVNIPSLDTPTSDVKIVEQPQTASTSDENSQLAEIVASSTDVASSTPSSTAHDLNSVMSTVCLATSTIDSIEVATSTVTQANATSTSFASDATSSEPTSSNPPCNIIPNIAPISYVGSSTNNTLSSTTPSQDHDIVAMVQAVGIATTTASTSGPTILSGKAVAEANIINIANTDIVNSSGSVIFSNLNDLKKGALDLRGSNTASSTCSITSCAGQANTEIQVSNDARISNLIQLDANSGDNTIIGEGDAVIQTGDAFAALNLVNIANVNLIGSQYLIVALNAFKGIDGDIIFPNLDKFFNSQSASPSSLTLENSAEVSNNVAINTESGNNQVTAASSTINAGDAKSKSNVYNQINSTLGSGDMVSILFNVHGAWNGNLVNAPFGLKNSRTADGSYFLSSPFYPAPLVFGGLATDSPIDGSLSIMGTSSAHIENNIYINAHSGNNTILSTGSGLINSGNSYAGANVINIANASVIGKNWLLAIINIFGDFNGDITFGRPDLWVGDRVETAPPFINGNELTYRFTILNKGDAPSSKVTLLDTLDTVHLDIVRSSLPYHMSNNQLVWDLGDLPQGAATELTLTVRIKGDVPEGTSIENRVSVYGTEAESIAENNNDINVIKTYILPSVSGSSGGGTTIILITPNRASGATNVTSGSVASSSQPASTTTQSVMLPIDITRSTATTTIDDIGVKSPQSIIIKNPNNIKITSVTFHDILLAPSGALIKNEEWDLGTLLPHEEITIGYDIAFNTNATSGVYFLSSTISRPNMGDRVYGVNGAIVLVDHRVVHTAPHSLGAPIQAETKILPETSKLGNTIASAVNRILPETAYAAINDEILVPDHSEENIALLFLFFMPMLLMLLFISIYRHKLMK